MCKANKRSIYLYQAETGTPWSFRFGAAQRFGNTIYHDEISDRADSAGPTCLKEQSRKIQNKSEKSMMKIERPDWAGTKWTNSE